MARSATLNPASMPFFPGSLRSDEEGGSGFGFRHHAVREHDRNSMSRNSMSSLSISPSDYRSVGSSPSPPGEGRDAPRHQPDQSEWSRQSPTFRQVDASRPYSVIEPRAREASMLGSLGTLPEGDDNQNTPGPTSGGNGGQTTGTGSFFSMQQQQSRERIATPPTTQNGPNFHSGAFTTSSPVSSLGSSVVDHHMGFEAQLKSSPLIHDILDRLVRCEYSTREVQRELGDMQRKINLLVERSGPNSQPEFKDPFAGPHSNGSSFNSPPLNGPRPSMGNIAPNQPAPSDDFSTISQRLNTLTSSVGQLLALQTQHIQSNNADIRNNSVIGMNPPQGDIGPNQMMPTQVSNSAMLGHGLPQRPDLRPSPRPQNPPMRTWSAGNLDLPIRGSDPNVGRPGPATLDKRRSVSGLQRRESSGVCQSFFFHLTDPHSTYRSLTFNLILGLEALLEIPAL